MEKGKKSLLVGVISIAGIMNAMDDNKKPVQELTKEFEQLKIDKQSSVQKSNNKQLLTVLPNGKKVVHHDFIKIMAAFYQMAPELQVELAKAVHKKTKLYDPKVISHLIAHDLANQEGRIVKPVAEVIAGVTSFKDGKLVINEGGRVEEKMLSPQQKKHPLRFSLKNHDNSKPGDSVPCTSQWACFFTVHELKEESDHCLTYCTGANHPTQVCRNGECKKHQELDLSKFAKDGHERVVEFVDYTGKYSVYYPRKSTENFQNLVAWARTQLWQPGREIKSD